MGRRRQQQLKQDSKNDPKIRKNIKEKSYQKNGKDYHKQRSYSKSPKGPNGEPSLSQKIELRKLLESHDLYIKEVAPDGNCLFHSFCFLIDEYSNDDHIELRNDVCDFMIENKDDFSAFMEDDTEFQTYMTNMRCSGVWASGQEITAIAKKFQIKVIIYRPPGQRVVIEVDEIKSKKDVREVNLYFDGVDHYNAIYSRKNVNFNTTPTSVTKPVNGASSSSSIFKPTAEFHSDLIDKTDISTKATETSGVGVEGWRENEDDGTGGDGGDGDWSLSKKETRRIAKLSKRIQREKDNEINSLQRSFDTIIL